MVTSTGHHRGHLPPRTSWGDTHHPGDAVVMSSPRGLHGGTLATPRGDPGCPARPRAAHPPGTPRVPGCRSPHLGDELVVPGQVRPAVHAAVGAVAARQVTAERAGGQAAAGGRRGGRQGPGGARGHGGHGAAPAEPLAGEAAQQSAQRRRSSRAEVGGARPPRAPPGEQEAEKGGGLRGGNGRRWGGHCLGPLSPAPPFLSRAPTPLPAETGPARRSGEGRRGGQRPVPAVPRETRGG